MEYITPSSMLGLAVSFMNICTIMIMLRIYVRRMQRLPLGLDDKAAIASWLLLVAMCINMITAVAYRRWGLSLPPRIDIYGYVDNYWGFSPQIAQSEQFAYVQEALFTLQLTFAKLSILFFIRRVFCVSTQGFLHWATWVMIGIVFVWGVTEFFVFVFQCGTRFSLIWTGPLVEEARVCLQSSFEFAFGVIDVGLELMIMLLPIRRILTLQMPRSKKLSVTAIFTVGGVTVAVGLIRIVVYTNLLSTAATSFTTADENMTISTQMFWAMLEAGFAVTTVCLPSMQFLVAKMASSIRGTNVYSKRYNYEYRGDSRGPTLPRSDLEACRTTTEITAGRGSGW